MILDHAIGVENVAADLAAPGDLELLALPLRFLLPPLGHLEIVETGTQDLHRRRPVLVLAALVLTRDDYVARQVGDAHR